MRHLPLVLFLAVAALVAVAPDSTAPLSAQMAQDTLQPRRDSLMNMVLRDIAGRENEPASAVFSNIKILGDVPAGRMLRMMNQGYSRNIGVSCDYCHDVLDFGSDEKREKETARAMIQLVATISGELRQISTIKSENPVVNCGTCHRGVPRPGVRAG